MTRLGNLLCAVLAGALLLWSVPAMAHAGHHGAPAAATAQGVGTVDAAVSAAEIDQPASPASAGAGEQAFVSGPADCPPRTAGHGPDGGCCHASSCLAGAALAPPVGAAPLHVHSASCHPDGSAGLTGLSGLPSLPPPRTAT